MTAIDGADAEQVAPALLAYLQTQLDTPDIAFAEPPEAIGRGFDTYIYAFRLEGAGVPDGWRKPLVLRLYPSADQDAKAAGEAAIQRFVAGCGYPAPIPLAIERTAASFGLPVMVLERVSGKSMLERLAANPLSVLGNLTKLAEAQAALHRLPVAGCPLPAGDPLIARQLARLREWTPAYPTEDMREAFAWLDEHKDRVLVEEPSICHGDFHPLNLMVADDGAITVLDWPEAVLGDRHFDVARTATLFWIAPIAAESTVERVVLRLARNFLQARYLATYRRQLPVDERRLTYWQAFHAFQGWVQVVALHLDSEAVTSRADTRSRVPPQLGDQLQRYFWRMARER